jgi:hypothetical protein
VVIAVRAEPWPSTVSFMPTAYTTWSWTRRSPVRLRVRWRSKPRSQTVARVPPFSSLRVPSLAREFS